MKIIKKILSLLVIVVCFVMSFNITPFAATENTTQMDELDVLLSANSVLNSERENYWTYSGGNTYDIIPLYSSSGELAAYYLHLDNGGYAVINNNKKNPVAIEFGASDNPVITKILDTNPEAKIIYNSPFSIYDSSANTFSLIEPTAKDIYENYPELKTRNPNLESLLEKQREIVSMSIVPYGDGDYGFIDWVNMPTASYSYDQLKAIDDVIFVTTGETEEFVSGTPNHCGCVAVANLSLYYQHIGEISQATTPLGAFMWAYPFVGNGPKMTIAPEAKAFMYDRSGLTLNYSSVYTMSGYEDAIKNNHPLGLLLADGIVEWHWILGVGYRTYIDSGDLYLRIVDGWHNKANRYYKPGSGSLWFSATEYWL